ncbi:hypothetical protein SeLEV6574_g06055 [Synchytrium endobioticum]|uniref:Uncharacterized protein n=1 Tax=Synchytrium endobioticum TaxID=286115 RepID=A0A507CQT0_9FUNG|nr:hypothetical protein SeLEV6574_g06055 [Synchytrium endobioticum]
MECPDNIKYIHPRANPARLPLELLHAILSHLAIDDENHAGDHQRHLYHASLTCTSWYLAGSSLLWNNPNFTTIHSFAKFIKYTNLIPTSPQSLHHTDPVEQNAKGSMLGHLGWHSFRSLSVKNASASKLSLFFNTQHLLSIAAAMPRLTTLNLCNCKDITDDGVVALVSSTAPYLQTLELDGCSQITDTSVCVIASFCSPWDKLSRLSHLDISRCKRISDLAVLALFQPQSDSDDDGRSSNRLSAAQTEDSRKVIPLESFKGYDLPKLTRTVFLSILDEISTRSELDTFEISIPSPPKASPFIQFNLPVKSLIHITRLHLAKCRYLEDTKISVLIDAVGKNLTELSIMDAVCPPEIFIYLLSHVSPRLKSLCLARSIGVTDVVVEHLRNSPCYGALEKLDLSGCLIISDSAFDNWFPQSPHSLPESEEIPCPNITTINISQCYKITTQTTIRFARYYLPPCGNLHQIDITNTVAHSTYSIKPTIFDLVHKFPKEYCKLHGITSVAQATYGMRERAALAMVPDVAGVHSCRMVLHLDELVCIKKIYEVLLENGLAVTDDRDGSSDHESENDSDANWTTDAENES